MRISDWSSDVCSSDLDDIAARIGGEEFAVLLPECDTDAAYGFAERLRAAVAAETFTPGGESQRITISIGIAELSSAHDSRAGLMAAADRSEEHTSELQSLMRISYAVFCLKKNTDNTTPTT